MLDRIELNYKIKPKRLLGDTAYGTGVMLEWLINDKQIEPHIPVWDKSTLKDGSFSHSNFIWHDEEDDYQCSAGKRLQRFWRAFKNPRTGLTKDNTVIYSARECDCEPCEYKQQCCANTERRRIKRSIYEASREITRSINQSDEYKNKSRAERKKVEMAFAHMKRHFNFHRLRLRGYEKRKR